jgi:hypothetical protein
MAEAAEKFNNFFLTNIKKIQDNIGPPLRNPLRGGRKKSSKIVDYTEQFCVQNHKRERRGERYMKDEKLQDH